MEVTADRRVPKDSPAQSLNLHALLSRNPIEELHVVGKTMGVGGKRQLARPLILYLRIPTALPDDDRQHLRMATTAIGAFNHRRAHDPVAEFHERYYLGAVEQGLSDRIAAGRQEVKRGRRNRQDL